MSDDGTLILRNPQITEPGHLGRILTTDWFDVDRPGLAIGYYRPVSKLSLRATWALAGPRPFWFHVGNVAAHGVAVLALALLLRALAGPAAALLGALLFAVHPMTVQAVDIVTARSDLLAALFSLWACAALVAFARTGKRVLVAACAVASLLAFGSKESAALLPAILAVVGLVAGLPPRRLAAALAPVLAGEALVLALRAAAVHVAPRPNGLAALPWSERGLAVLKALGTYGASLATGAPIVRLPQLPGGLSDPLVFLGALLAGCGVLAVVLLPRTRLAGFGAALIGASLAPALALWLIHIPRWHREVPVAERWLYLPCAGAGILWAALAARFPRRPVQAGIAAVTLAMAALTVDRSAMYASQEAMSRYVEAWYVGADETRMNPRERYFARTMRAAQLLREGRREDALRLLYEADAIVPAVPTHLPVIARLELDLGRPDRAVGALERLLSPSFATDPEAVSQRLAFGSDEMERLDRAPYEDLLGRAYGAAGRSRESVDAFAAAARTARGRPEEADYLVDLALALRGADRLGEARAALGEAAARRPGWTRPQLDLAALDLREGRNEDARRRLEPIVAGGGPDAARAKELLSSGAPR
jgi:tetratricopeptide (TPR) repeat protein